MRSNKWSSQWSSQWQYTVAVLALPVLMLAAPTSWAATATATVTINATFTMPTCTLTMPNSGVVQLGGLGPGITNHPSVKIGINCPGSGRVETGLYAQQISGALSGTDKVTMVGSTTTSTPALFWLTAGGTTAIKLDGTGASTTANAFCRGTGDERECTLTPHTQVFPGTPREEVSATVRFNVMYP